MKKILFSILFWVALMPSSYGWVNSYNPETFGNADKVVQLEDGSYVLMGLNNDSIDCGSSHFVSDQKIYLSKVKPSGQQVWSMTYDHGDYVESPTSIRATRDGGFLVVGAYFESWTAICSGSFGGGNSNSLSFVAKFNSQGNLLWQKSFDFAHYGDDLMSESEGFTDVTESIDGSIYLIGNLATMSAENDSSSYSREYLLKLDQIGHLKWVRFYDADSAVFRVVKSDTMDGVHILADTGSGSTRELAVLRVQANGDMLWQKSISSSGSDVAVDLQVVDGDSYVLATKRRAIDSHNKVWLLHLSSEGNLVRDSYYSLSEISNDDGVRLLSSEGGMKILASTSDDPTRLGGAPLFFSVNDRGDPLWARRYFSDQNSFSTLDYHSDGFVMAGISVTAQRILMTTDSLGSTGLLCEKSVTISSGHFNPMVVPGFFEEMSIDPIDEVSEMSRLNTLTLSQQSLDCDTLCGPTETGKSSTSSSSSAGDFSK